MAGGARARSGPPPDPDALRRARPDDARRNGEWAHLPAAGRQGDAPPWPLAGPTARELNIWTAEWRRPQAIMWEALGRHHEVAVHVRTLVRFEQDVSASLGSLLRGQQMDLGLSVPGLRANRWIIDAAATVAAPVRKHDGRRAAARSRFQSIEGGAAS